MSPGSSSGKSLEVIQEPVHKLVQDLNTYTQDADSAMLSWISQLPGLPNAQLLLPMKEKRQNILKGRSRSLESDKPIPLLVFARRD
jgi:hypothetical protein